MGQVCLDYRYMFHVPKKITREFEEVVFMKHEADGGKYNRSIAANHQLLNIAFEHGADKTSERKATPQQC